MNDFIREDWTKFRSLGELPRAAGVPVEKLKRLVVKELTDNALDAAGACRIGLDDAGVFWVEDDGPGIAGTPEQIADLFSIRRHLTSSKQLRLPTRGALGNGLRVVSGYALTMGGALTVCTSGRRLELTPDIDGGTRLTAQSQDNREGTRIELRLGQGERFEPADLVWARFAINLSGAPEYSGDSSPYWFDEDAFFELCQAYSGYARDLIARFDGCKNPKAGTITAPWKGRLANSLTREECGALLFAARAASKPCKAQRLGFIGRDHRGMPGGYARATGAYSPASAGGTLRAELPFIVETWAQIHDTDSVTITVNRTPITAQIELQRLKPKGDLGIFGCGLSNRFSVGQKPVQLIINVQTPYMGITSDGKAPDLMPMFDEISGTIETATKSARRLYNLTNPTARRRPETEIVRDVLEVAIDRASGGGASRYSLRQLFYQVRPFIISELGKEPDFDYFGSIITDIENEAGHDIPGMYRDTRGVLYHPHTREEIALGTLAVESYERPEWTFNKILYCEKEGFFELLKDTQWPERHDCALLTSKGQPTRAARDVLDLMSESEEALTFFCIHDADAAGSIIYQSLQDATKARAARRFAIINLGLEPDEALEMGLAPETMDKPADGKQRPVAAYVQPHWAHWLQTRRVELNAMTSPQFIEWLDSKMAQHNGEKLIPPGEVMEKQLLVSTRHKVETELTAKILKSANLNKQVEDAMSNLHSDFTAAAARLDKHTRQALAQDAAKSWKSPVDTIAQDLATRATTP